LSSTWTDLFATPIVAVAWCGVFVLAGGQLLLRFLNYRPVTRRAVLHAAWNFVAGGCWITFGTAAISAQERGLISLPASILAVAALMAVAAGGTHLMMRWYPDDEP